MGVRVLVRARARELAGAKPVIEQRIQALTAENAEFPQPAKPWEAAATTENRTHLLN